MSDFTTALTEIGLGNVANMFVELGKRLECPVCFTPMTTPKTLFCEHMVCESCLQMVIKTSCLKAGWYKCPVCKEYCMTIDQRKTNCQFAEGAKMMGRLVEVLDKQIYEVYHAEDGCKFLGLLNDGPANKKRKVEKCAVCNEEWLGQDDKRVWAPDCDKCGRAYHLDCHYPKLCSDIGCLEEWECRMCSDETPEMAYGYSKERSKSVVSNERRVLKNKIDADKSRFSFN